MTKPIIITFVPIPEDIPSYSYLSKNYTLLPLPLTTEDETFEKFQTSPYNEAVAIFGSYPGFSKFGGVHDKSLIDKLPPNLKVIALCSAGYGGYDLPYLKSRGIKLCHVPTGAAQKDAADCVMWHVISGIRKFNVWNNLVKDEIESTGSSSVSITSKTDPNNDGVLNTFSFGHILNNHVTRRPSGMKAIILGYGGIGKETAKRLSVMGMDVSGVVRSIDKYKTGEDQNGNPIDVLNTKLWSIDNLKEACKGKDVVVLALPGHPNTNNIFNKDIIDVLNDGAIVVNVGRGSLINDADLKNACKSGKISHVGLDVYSSEPKIDPFWVENDSDISASLTPHIAVCTLESYMEACETCVSNIISGVETGSWKHVVN